MQLNRVVLPAPFGPISPQMAPLETSKLTSSSAVTPPNRIVTPSTASSADSCGSTLSSAVPAFASASSMNIPFPTSWSDWRRLLLAVLTFPAALSPALFDPRLKADSPAPLQEGQHACLVYPVADGEIVVASGNVERLRMRHHCCELVRIARDDVARPDRNERRRGNTRDCGRRQALTRAPDAGGEGGAIALRPVGEGAERALRRVGEAVERRRLHRLGDAFRQAGAMHEPVAEAAQDQRTHEIRLRQREEARDAGAHRIAHHVGPLDLKASEEIARVARHQLGAIVGRRVRLLARPVAAIVEGDDAPPRPGQRLDPARIDPVDAMVRSKAMDQQNRLAAVGSLRRDVDEGDVNTMR